MQTFCFKPVAVDTPGVLGDGAYELICDLRRHIAEATREHRASELLFQRLIAPSSAEIQSVYWVWPRQ